MFLSRNAAADVREITRSRGTRDKTDVSSSVRPFAQKSLAGSEVKLMNGRTAMDTVAPTGRPVAEKHRGLNRKFGYVCPLGTEITTGSVAPGPS